MRDHSLFVCLVDKHWFKIRAKATSSCSRKRRQSNNESRDLLLVALVTWLHSCMHISLILSLALMVDSSSKISGSWYHSQIYVCCLVTPMENLVTRLFSFVCSCHYFPTLHLDLDFLCAARTKPCHSWHTPVRQMMAVLNLSGQCVGLVRAAVSDDLE